MMRVAFSGMSPIDNCTYDTPKLDFIGGIVLSCNCQIAEYTHNGFWQTRNGKFFTSFSIISQGKLILIGFGGRRVPDIMDVEVAGSYLRFHNDYLHYKQSQNVWQHISGIYKSISLDS